ncbi:thermonuclease family protein [Jannaschia marina]|uniref:thermonuclease family protein n=1 Tax=Jannaschia marina TaxID=2741674 RepID=UPI0015CE79EF|nr:thermonuclease family protein [Jannaschia marina]
MALLGTGDAAQAETIQASAIYVIDGDTVDMSGQRYRLVGFDTPETYHAQCDYELALGQEATRRVRELVASGRTVELSVLPGQDRYGRGFARLFVGGVDVGTILMSEGFARQYDGGRREGWC